MNTNTHTPPYDYQGEDQKKFHFLFLLRARRACVTTNSVLVLEEIDPKMVFMTARPGRIRAFVLTDKWLRVWQDEEKTFLQEPPRVAILHTKLPVNEQEKTEAVGIHIERPRKQNDGCWAFTVQQLTIGQYDDVTLLIDWPAALPCPMPIQKELPMLFGGYSD